MNALPTMTSRELRRIRDTLMLTQTEMAGLLGAGVRTYKHWEAGDRAIPGPAVLLARLRLQMNKPNKPIIHEELNKERQQKRS